MVHGVGCSRAELDGEFESYVLSRTLKSWVAKGRAYLADCTMSDWLLYKKKEVVP